MLPRRMSPAIHRLLMAPRALSSSTPQSSPFQPYRPPTVSADAAAAAPPLRFASLFCPTRRDAPQDAVLPSHQLLIRGGYMRMTAGRGLYTLLPLALRTLSKIEAIVDEELQAIGCAKLSMPIMLSSEDWIKTGRWTSAGEELLRLQDRHKGWYCIAPTAEEPITALVASEVSSPRQLPLRLYQIGKKYRDEMRPRFGLLRSREFIMKDLYTFDSTQEQAFATYDAVSDAYFRIFRRMAFDVVRCEADSGNIGGNRSHEFHVVTPTGFDDLLRCSQCDYAANVEKAASRMISAGQSTPLHPNVDTHASMTKVYQAAQQAAKGFTLAAPDTLSCHVVVPVGAADTKPADSKANANRIALVFTPQGRQAQPLALKDALGSWGELRVVDDAEQVNTLLAAADVTKLKAFIDVNTVAPTEAKSNFIGHFALSAAGDQCPRCSGSLQASKGVEVGHVFYLGQKYSKLLAANIVTAEQKKQPIEMGCFGIGVTRILAAAVEAAGGHDANGIRWPEAIAPYRAVLISAGSTQQDEQCVKLYAELMRRVPSMRGELVLDDRNFAEHRFGSKLKDAQLVGFPWIVIGGKSLDVDGKFEVQHRASGEKRMLTVAEIVTLFGGQ